MKQLRTWCQMGALLLVLTSSAWGAEFCVTNGGQLQVALNNAEVNGQADTIRLAQGACVSGADGFVFDTRNNPNGDDFGVSLIGGWSRAATTKRRSTRQERSGV